MTIAAGTLLACCAVAALVGAGIALLAWLAVPTRETCLHCRARRRGERASRRARGKS